MKKVLIILFLVASIIQFSQAQEIGIRFGDALGSNHVAVDGIIGIGEFSRIHGDISFGNGVGIEALWDFIYKPIGGEAFNWYLGAGPSLFIGDPFQFGISGEIGLEYHFNGVPIAIGVDWRPTFVIVEETDFRANGFGFNVRWVFGKN